MRFSLIFLPVLTACFSHAQDIPLPTAKPVPRVQAVPMPHHITSFQIDGREVVSCHYDPADRRVFWHPIRASRDISLTRMGHPHDPLTHSHHNSVWIAHNDVDGVNYWADHGKSLGQIACMEISRGGYEEGDEFASMRMVNHWKRQDDGSVQLIETRRTEVRPLDGARSWFLIVDMEFTPPKGQTVTFKPSGFGLMAVRMARSIGVRDGGGRILNSEGQVNEKAMFRLPARWCDYSGRITNEADGFAGVTLMNHPLNPQNPAPYHVRDDGWMGACLNLETPSEVGDEKKLRLRYALWVHDGMASQESAETHWKRFTELPVADLAQKKN
jgi:hypothetical protein